MRGFCFMATEVFMTLFIRNLVVLFLLSLAFPLAGQQTRLGTDTEAPPQRLALLIGNSTYEHLDKLKNPRNDVDKLGVRLTALGFQTSVKYDLNHDDFVAAVSDFQNRIEPGAIVLFYYSGHGVQVGGANYLIPVTMPAGANAATLTGIGIPLTWVREHLDGARLSLVILDACRSLANIPAKGPAQGLAPLFARGSLIAYAADEGQTASDNDAEDLSLFTKHLIAELDKSDETLCQLFGGVRAAVDKASSHVQFPFVYDGVIGDFIFNRATTGESQKLSQLSTTVGRDKLWSVIQDSSNPNDYAAFLSEGPDKGHVKIAIKRLNALMSGTAKAVAVTPAKRQETPDVIALDNQGSRLFYERAYAAALLTYEKLVSLRPAEMAPLYNYATCLLYLGRYEEAEQSFTKALQIDAEFPWAYHNRGVAKHLKGNFVDAIEDYNQALKRRPNYALGYNNLALAKRDTGDLAGAQIDAQKAIDLDPHYAPAFFNSAEIWTALGDPTAAARFAQTGRVLTRPTVQF
jgi:tetratricopeptide (TPR) repeat protein